jgi:Mg2+/Co2+ transporter CorC
MPARTPIADLEEIFEVDIDEDDVDTVYGLLTTLLGRVPIVGMSAITRGLQLTAVDSAGRRKKVSTVLVEPVSESMDAQNEPATSPASRHETQNTDNHNDEATQQGHGREQHERA